MKNRTMIVLTLAAIFAVFGFVLFKLVKENRALKRNTAHLMEGERIEYFDLINLDSERVDASVLEDKISFIFLFPRPCAPCSANIIFWNQMKKLMGHQGQVIGVVLGGPNAAAEIIDSKKVKFPVFLPDDLERFLETMNVNYSYAQTILYHDNRVKMIRMGDLDGEGFTEMLKEAKKIAQETTEKENS